MLRHRIRKYPDSPVHTLSDSSGFIFSTLESGKCSDSLPYSPNACGRKPYLERKVTVKKYLDTCGRYSGLVAKMYQSDCSNSIAGLKVEIDFVISFLVIGEINIWNSCWTTDPFYV